MPEAKAHPAAPTSKTAKYLVCVDQREESRVALRFACMRARNRNGKVDLLHVIAPVDFQTLHSVADRLREESRAEAEKLMQTRAEEAYALSGILPVIHLREGQTGEEIVAAALEDPHLNTIVLGVAQQSASRGKLAGWLAGQLGSRLFIPLLLVPGNLTDQQLENLM